MIEEIGNLWDKHNAGHPICITTNGFVKSNGQCVMGRGIALEAKRKFPALPRQLGNKIKENGNKVFFFEEYNLFSFPVKDNWWEEARPSLIIQSLIDLKLLCQQLNIQTVYIPRPGCGNGRLTWENIKPLLEPFCQDELCVFMTMR